MIIRPGIQKLYSGTFFAYKINPFSRKVPETKDDADKIRAVYKQRKGDFNEGRKYLQRRNNETNR